MAEKRITVENMEELKALFGELDKNMEVLERELNISVRTMDGGILLRGEELLVDLREKSIDKLLEILHEEGRGRVYLKKNAANGPLDKIGRAHV